MNLTPDALKLYDLLATQINTLGWTCLLAYVARLTQQYLMHRLTVLQHGILEAVSDCGCMPHTDTDATAPGSSTGTNAIGFHHAAEEPAEDEDDE